MKIFRDVSKKVLHTTLGPEHTNDLMIKYNDLKILTQCGISPNYQKSVTQLRKYMNKHVGEKCFIIGNGPSLKKMDLNPLKDEITFGLNRIYLLFDSMGFVTKYFVAVNQLLIEQFAEDIIKLPCPKFIGWHARHLIPSTPDMMFLRSRRGPKFCTDITREGVWEGATVTYVAMQIAYYMGFKQIILIGVDHSFQSTGPAHKLVVSKGDDPNHFHPEYFGKDVRWNLPDLETSELAYKLAKNQFELAGREVLDATVGGKLQVFPKVDYTEIVGEA